MEIQEREAASGHLLNCVSLSRACFSLAAFEQRARDGGDGGRGGGEGVERSG